MKDSVGAAADAGKGGEDMFAVVRDLQQRLSPAPRSVVLSDGLTFLHHAPHIWCADGLTMSVQASSTHYCQPRNNSGPWHMVEVGYPSRCIPTFMEYMDGNAETTDPTQTVYGYVPITIVAQAIADAGGMRPATSPASELIGETGGEG